MVEGLIGLHALTGADKTDRIACKGKITRLNFFQKAEPIVLVAFIQLGMTVHPPEDGKCWSLRIHVFFIQSGIWGAECDQTTLADV